MKKINTAISELLDTGIMVLEGAYTKKRCHEVTTKLESILDQRIKNNKFIGHPESIVIHNYLRDCIEFYDLVLHESIDKILKEALHEDYVLINMAARNRTTKYLKNKTNEFASSTQIGYGWHVDARETQNKDKISGSSYIVMTFLEDVDEHNAPTLYIPGSHLRGSQSVKDMETTNSQTLRAKAGTAVIMDANMIHSGNDATENSRWTIFNLYSHWHVKPYFDYPKMFEKNESLLGSETKKLLHFNSSPPIDENERVNTLVK